MNEALYLLIVNNLCKMNIASYSLIRFLLASRDIAAVLLNSTFVKIIVGQEKYHYKTVKLLLNAVYILYRYLYYYKHESNNTKFEIKGDHCIRYFI